MIKLKPFAQRTVFHFHLVFRTQKRDFYWIRLVVLASEKKQKTFPRCHENKHRTQLLPFLFRSNIYISMMYIPTSHLMIRPESLASSETYRQERTSESKEIWVLVKLCVDKSFFSVLFVLCHIKQSIFCMFDLLFLREIRWRHNIHTRVHASEKFRILFLKGYRWKLCWGQIWEKIKKRQQISFQFGVRRCKSINSTRSE